MNIKDINSITFGVLSSDQILNLSVAKIDQPKSHVAPGTVYDPKMGLTTDSNTNCITCGNNSIKCSGHFGHIELNKPIIHPFYMKNITHLLRSFCFHCSRLKITEAQLAIHKFDRYKGSERFEKIASRLEKINDCPHPNCNKHQPKISYSKTDGTFTSCYYETKDTKDTLAIKRELDQELEQELGLRRYETKQGKKGKKGKIEKDSVSIVLSVEEIYKIFDSIIDSDLILCGLTPENFHPRNLIMFVIPVIPPCDRPFVIVKGDMNDDDLTTQYIDIVKQNIIIGKELDKNRNVELSTEYKKAMQTLKFKVSTLINNSDDKAKHPTNGRPIKGIKERLTGKPGLIRHNLMGKRVNFSSRTVIGPDPNMPFGWLAIPKHVSEIETIPETVTPYNIDKMNNIINCNKANFVIRTNGNRINLKYALYSRGTPLLYNDVIIRKGNRIKITERFDQLVKGDLIERDGKLLSDVKYKEKKKVYLNIGDIVHRHLVDGDIVLLNRQPTLHKGSMLSKKIKVIKGKTFRMNLGTTKSFNADFDGDEMNIHVPQSIQARAELEYLSASKYQVISGQASKPNIVIVQDSLLAAYMMTKSNDTLKPYEFFNISMSCKLNGEPTITEKKLKRISKIMRKYNKKAYTGSGLISLILPKDLCYVKKNNAKPDEPEVIIENGVLCKGAFDKSILGSSHNSLIQIINKEYGIDIISEFITNIQFITNKWLLVHGFSIGLQDCLITSEKSKIDIEDKISKCYIEAEGIKQTTKNPTIREIRVTAALNKAKDVGMRIAKEAMSKNNNLLSTVYSGSKGDFFNISQLTGLLGQQNLAGSRVKPSLNNNTRTLPHYPFTGSTNEMLYESRGFIRHSFIEGLNPKEFYFHAMSGREGICDTAMGTADSGYIQRRIIKLCEDIKVMYDGTVRDTTGRIIQPSYGYNGLDPTQTVKVDKKQQVCDVNRLVHKLNIKYN